MPDRGHFDSGAIHYYKSGHWRRTFADGYKFVSKRTLTSSTLASVDLFFYLIYKLTIADGLWHPSAMFYFLFFQKNKSAEKSWAPFFDPSEFFTAYLLNLRTLLPPPPPPKLLLPLNPNPRLGLNPDIFGEFWQTLTKLLLRWALISSSTFKLCPISPYFLKILIFFIVCLKPQKPITSRLFRYYSSLFEIV